MIKDFRSLTRRGRAQRYRKALVQALKDYPVEVRSLKFVSLDSKPVFHLTTDKGCYAAKFHDPSEHILSQMKGEMKFLDHIANQTDLHVETPLANRFGRFITEIKSPWLPEPAHVALYGWTPGRQLRDCLSARSYYCLGLCSAMLHDASLTFKPGGDFNILNNNRVFYWDKETILSRCDSKLLPWKRQSLFAKGAQIAQEAIKKIWMSGEPLVIHNDLHPSNVKIHRGILYLYDFEDISRGFPQQDIGTAIYHIRFEDNFSELLSAYRAG